MSHSCKPNGCWFSLQDGRKKLVRLITPVKEGEEVTISYIKSLLEPMHVQCLQLLKAKYFNCSCKRCSQDFDETQRFYCNMKHCIGVHFVYQPSSWAKPILLDCTDCNKSLSEGQATGLLDRERILHQEIEVIDNIADSGMPIDVTRRIKKLCPPHPFHHLAAQCYSIQFELYHQLGQFRSAAQAMQCCVACHDAILGSDYPTRDTAFACEHLGDALVQFDPKAAEKAYQRAVQILQITDGPLQPYSKEAVSKLLFAQCRLYLLKKCIAANNRHADCAVWLRT